MVFCMPTSFMANARPIVCRWPHPQIAGSANAYPSSGATHEERFALLANRVRSWATCLLASCSDDDEAAALQMDILDTIHFFESGRKALEWGGVSDQFPRNTLIHAVCLGSNLGSNKHVSTAIPIALKVSLPQMDLSHFMNRLRFPHASTIGRAGPALDFAYLLTMRKTWSDSNWCHSAWADSSPQAGREWFMLMHAAIQQDALVAAADAANRLSKSRPDFYEHFEAEDLDIEEVKALHQALLQAVTHHKCIPVALGSGKVSLEDKVACPLHATGCECVDARSLQRHLNSFVSWTTDLGTEALLPSFQAKGLSSVLPRHLVQPLESDIVNGDEPLPQNDVPCRIMPQALLTAGSLHITHNAKAKISMRKCLGGKNSGVN